MDRSSLMPGSSGLEEAKKKKNKKKPFSRTYRFNLSLDISDDEGKTHYPDFNWLDLVAQEEEARVEAKRKEVLDPFASDDEDQLKAIARQFEEKYGGATEKIKQKKKARKLDDYADLGYGYDSNDPFIDNSDVHDEIVPENLTTAHGGFYVNCGPLEFKARESADEDSDVEAVLAESEKAAKKRKNKKSSQEPVTKKSKVVSTPGAPPTVPSGPSSPTKSTSATTTPVITNGQQLPPKKPRVRKEGGKPLGRPKKRNPDGTLVHPPKPKKDKLPNSGQSGEKPKVATPGSSTAGMTSEAGLRQQLLDQQKEEMLQKQLMEQVLEMQRRQEEYMKEQLKEQQKRLEQQKRDQAKRLLEQQQKAEAEKRKKAAEAERRKKEQQKYIEQQKQQMLQQQRQLQELEKQEKQRLMILKQQEEQKRLLKQQEEQKRLLKQQEEQKRLLKQQEEQKRILKQQEEAKRLQQQKLLQQKREQELRLQQQKQEQEKQRLLKQQQEQQQRLLKQQQEEQQRRIKEQLLKQQQEEQARRLKQQQEEAQKEQQRKLQQQREQERKLQQQREQERKLREQQEQQKRLQQQREQEKQRLLKQEQEKQKRLQEEQQRRLQHEQALLKQQEQQRLLQMQQQQQRLPTSLSIQSLSKSDKSPSTANSQQPSAQQLLQHLQQQVPYSNYNSVKSSSISVQMVSSSPTTMSTTYNGHNTSGDNQSVGVSPASVTVSPQQQQRLQQQQQQQFTKQIQHNQHHIQKSPTVQTYSNSGNGQNQIITAENASQMLATMQPQPPSSLASYFKQTSPNCQQQQPKSTQSSPLQQTSPVAYQNKSPSTTNVPRSIAHQTSPNIHHQFVSPAQTQQATPPKSQQQGYFTADSRSPASIRLPTVPVPTTSMFSTSMSPVISSAATQNYIFTSLPQHTSQPNFDVTMLQAKPMSGGNRIPVQSNANDNAFQQFMNMPK